MQLKMFGIFTRCCAFRVLDVENAMDKKEESVQVASSSPRPEKSTAGTNLKYRSNPDATQSGVMVFPFSATGSKSELKMLIEQEVREQLLLVSGQLDQQMKITAECYDRAAETSRPKKQTQNVHK